MKRSAIQLANNTLVVSLPAKWARQNSIEKGTQLEIDLKEKLLIVRKESETSTETKKATVDISGMSASLVWNYLNAIYRTGATEIEIHFSQPEIKDIKTGQTHKTIDLVARITDKLIGVEIISQSKNSCTLKEITQPKGDEYTNVFNRIFLSLLAISADVLEAAKKKDKETLENIYIYSEVNVNKLSDYCLRILNMQGLKDFKDSNINYLATFLLEEVGDCYAHIARVISENHNDVQSSETLDLFEFTNELLKLSHKFYLNPKKEYYLSFHEKRNDIKQRIKGVVNKKKGMIEVLFTLRMILDKLMEANNAVISGQDIFQD